MKNPIQLNSVIIGNCLEILPQIKLQFMDNFIIVTDPPFNIGYHYNGYNDKMNTNDYYDFLKNIFDFSPFVVVHYAEEIYKIALKMSKCTQKVVSWVYNSNTPKQHRDIAFFDVKPNFKNLTQPYKNPNDKRIAARILAGKSARGYDWWNVNQVKNVSKEKTSHPCQMPLEVMENVIKLLPEDKIIVDTFAGSGTTLLVCKNLNRNYIGIEIDKSYVDIINKRLK